MTVRLAVFDCDGTLVDGQAAVCRAMDAAFASVGLPLPDHHQVRRIVGLSLPQAMRLLLPDADETLRGTLDQAYREAFRAARESGQLSEPLYEGIDLLLDGLAARGWLLGVATGKSQRGLEHCLAAHGLSRRFVTLQTADFHPSKPHPAMLEAALAEAGCDAANAAGVRAVGVDWGYHTARELFDAGAEAVAANPPHLLELLP
jgi:phosphoglycolate phosphatase